MYYFWSKCEHEIILSPWTGQVDDIKIYIYDQIMINLLIMFGHSERNKNGNNYNFTRNN